MEFGNLLLFLALLTSTFSTAMWRKRPELAESLLYLSTSLCFAAFMILVYYFLTDSFSIWYVYANSNSEMNPLFKFSAVWAGKEGSLLLWALINLTIASIFVSSSDKNRATMKAAFVMSLFSTYLLGVAFITSNPFVTLPYTPYNGVGLNPLLRTVEMVLHPPIVFTAYSLSALLFSTSIAGCSTRFWAKLTWIFFTVGILIGGWWAYRTLGWGGFWGWDPVENASLLPWIAITLYFHTKNREIFAYLAFTLTLFAAFVTRSGVVSSVHSFGSGSDIIYILPILAMLPFLVSKLRAEIESVCTYAPALFLSSIAVVFIGTVASLLVSVNRTYYLVTFLPIFAILAFLIILKFKTLNAKVLHLGVVLLFFGSASVWLFEQHTTMQLTEDEVLGFRLNAIQLSEDAEKITVTANVTTPYGTAYPKVHIYKIERRDREVSAVDIISYPWADQYFAIQDFNLEERSVVLEHYTVPLVILVWLGAILMIAGCVGRIKP